MLDVGWGQMLQAVAFRRFVLVLELKLVLELQLALRYGLGEGGEGR